MHYLETSAFTKLYIEEPGTMTMLGLASRSPSESLAVLVLTKVEFQSALRKRERIGDLTREEVERTIEAMRTHFLEGRFVCTPLTEEVLEKAATLIDRHPLRAYDAVQLAGCLLLKQSMGADDSIVFVCSDNLLLRAAEKEHLRVLNPALMG